MSSTHILAITAIAALGGEPCGFEGASTEEFPPLVSFKCHKSSYGTPQSVSRRKGNPSRSARNFTVLATCTPGQLHVSRSHLHHSMPRITFENQCRTQCGFRALMTRQTCPSDQ